MKLILRNQWFRIAVGFIIAQQVLIGLSTYYIGSAGRAVSAADQGKVLHSIVLFFASVAMAYLLGGTGQWLTTRLANDSWRKYAFGLLGKIGRDPQLSSEKNKVLTNIWICGEALSTLESASSFLVDIVAIYLNITFTLLALFVVLGPVIAGSIAVALVVSFLILIFAYRVIQRMANQIQDAKLDALVSLQRIWDHLFFANRAISQLARRAAEDKTSGLFQRSETYKLLEQTISCLPVMISIPLLLVAISHEIASKHILLGALVAILPRSLQLFQNIHAANSYAGQFILMKSKLANLENFEQRLEIQNLLAQVSAQEITVSNLSDASAVPVQAMLSRMQEKPLSMSGRYLISGRNGSGKSSLLRILKAQVEDAVLLGPNIQLGHQDVAGSTGERQVKMIDSLIEQGVTVLLLDEWDANLDAANTEKLDRRLFELAGHLLVVEVRHSR
jgi:ABC-type bacteriocin/lantibiotic exporter with double-glycine peptidase domain